MVSEFPFQKTYFPWQEQQVKSFGCFWDIFERGSREQRATTSLLIKVWTSPTADKHNGNKLQLIHPTLFKKERERGEKVPFRVKTPSKMHSTDAFYLKKPRPFPLRINQFHRGKTQLALCTQLLIDRTHSSCVGWFISGTYCETWGTYQLLINLKEKLRDRMNT